MKYLRSKFDRKRKRYWKSLPSRQNADNVAVDLDRSLKDTFPASDPITRY